MGHQQQRVRSEAQKRKRSFHTRGKGIGKKIREINSLTDGKTAIVGLYHNKVFWDDPAGVLHKLGITLDQTVGQSPQYLNINHSTASQASPPEPELSFSWSSSTTSSSSEQHVQVSEMSQEERGKSAEPQDISSMSLTGQDQSPGVYTEDRDNYSTRPEFNLAALPKPQEDLMDTMFYEWEDDAIDVGLVSPKKSTSGRAGIASLNKDFFGIGQ